MYPVPAILLESCILLDLWFAFSYEAYANFWFVAHILDKYVNELI